MSDCIICQKHADTGPLAGGVRVWSGEHVVVYHKLLDNDGTTFLGYCFIETLRHVASLDELTEEESLAVARTRRSLAIGLKAALDASNVFSAVVGRGVPHFHEHVFVRYTGTPDEYAWLDGDEWEGAGRGDTAAVEALASSLRAELANQPAGRVAVPDATP
jgi:ATP adenylyltransferase